ncbi:MAG: 1-deoxy-D-xylulose-5-phosphate reductoisomerase [Chloroflexota bacterium]|nr:1-deoxy-D-xylulose-5-phosphate reductoisomerase [Chloroflexota bacterium]MDE3100903.1 1-deoxy-D-xylulose-5-phosphate reductoisomerase [Chloroflexota bacterium]
MSTTRLAILGVTGSIGRQALDVVAAHPDRLRVTRSGHRGDDLVALATADDVDLVLVATPGVAGLEATVAALEAGKRVALANKEVLVVGGHLVRRITGGAGDLLRPVDSEHCAIWQCLAGVQSRDVARVTLTASGGAFRDLPASELAGVTPERALRHPTWRMGPKVTIDSATLVNKAYEVIETHWLYGVDYDRIDVVLHPESVVHALVELVDGAVIAQLAEPDMRLPIQYALLWEHTPSRAPRLDLSRARGLTFRGAPDAERYPCFDLVLRAARSGDAGALIGVSAADEIAVERFLSGEIGFTDIAGTLRAGIAAAESVPLSRDPSLEEIRAADRAVRAALAGEATAARA